MKKLLPALFILVAVIGGVKMFSCYHEHLGAEKEQSRIRERALDSLQVRVKQLKTDSANVAAAFAQKESTYAVQRQRLLDLIAARIAPRSAPVQPVPRETDTRDIPLVADTPGVAAVPPLPDSAVAQFIQTADSTIKACSVVVMNCERRAATYLAQRDTAYAELADRKRRDRLFGLVPLPDRQTSFLFGAAAGLAVGLLTR